MTSNSEKVKLKLLRARSDLLLAHPFFGHLTYSLDWIEDSSVKTMLTNGLYVKYNPDFVMELEMPELRFVIAHEISHCTNRHMTRRNRRDKDMWNEAADYRINYDLLSINDPRLQMPQEGLYDPQYKDDSAEEIYEKLQQQQQQQQQQGPGQPGSGGPGQQGQGSGKQPDKQPGNTPGNGPSKPANGNQQGKGQSPSGQGQNPASGQPDGPGEGGDPGGCGGVEDAPAEQGEKEVDKQWEVKLRQAISIAKNAGKLPAHIERLVKDLAEPRVSWKELVREFIDAAVQKDYTWQRPNRRFIGEDIILPGFSPTIGVNRLVCVVDTSGSISNEMLKEFGGMIGQALDENIALQLTIIYADAAVNRIEYYDQGDTVPDLKAVGGGGTNFAPAFAWINKEAWDASVVVYLTDMQTSGWGVAPSCPVLWLAYDTTKESFPALAKRAPFGTAVRMEP